MSDGAVTGQGAAGVVGENDDAQDVSWAHTSAQVERARPSAAPLTVASMLLPGALVVLTGFNAGGYFPSTPAIVAILLTQLLLVRALVAERPFEGLAPVTLLALLALTAYAGLTLASTLWSHSLGRTLIELDRVWMYLLVLLLFGTVQASSANLRWLVRGLALGGAAVCVAGLASRVAPDVWHTAPDVANERLSYPVTYWNALGLLAALTILFSAHLACSGGERRLTRALASAAMPLLGATLFFTFSRGSIAVCALGVLVYALVGRPRGLLSGALATIPPTAIVVVAAYNANLLDTVDPTTPAAVSQGHRVALLALACSLVAAVVRILLGERLDKRLRSLSRKRASARMRLGGILVAVASVAVIASVAGVPGIVVHDWDRFASGARPHGERGDLRQRLTDPSNNQRTLLWQAAVEGFEESPAHGHGAGTYQTVWDRRRPRYVYTVDAHSLYLQAMTELGVPGVALLALLLCAALVGLASRARGPRRSLYGVLLAGTLAWALHAGVDWDWEMPVVTLPFFAIAGVGLSPRGRDARSWSRARGGRGAQSWSRARGGRGARPVSDWAPGHSGRIALSLALLLTLALPVLLIGSQRRLEQAQHALYASHCASATRAALSSIAWLDVRSQPYEVLGFCDLQRGFPHLAIDAMRQAVSRDPLSWEPYYGLAIALASAGVDPRADARRALEMDPYEPLVRQEASQLRTESPTEWVRRGALLQASALKSNRLSIAPA